MKGLLTQVGFHLIEILITLTIITIMSTWLLNYYQHTMVTVHRQEAQLALIKLAAAMEDFALRHQSYSGVTLRKLHFNAGSLRNYYELRIIKAESQLYWIAAEPKGKQAKIDIRCGKLLLSSSGEKRISGKAKPDECWQF